MLIREKRLPDIIEIYGCLDFFFFPSKYSKAHHPLLLANKNCTRANCLYLIQLRLIGLQMTDERTDGWTDWQTDRRKYEGTNRRPSGFLKSGYHRSKNKKPFLRYTNCLSIEQQSTFPAQFCTYAEQRLLHSVGDTFKHSSLNRVSRKGSTEVNL